ncbi:MAG: hypothetical protein EOM25_03370 [Deltaproteobacteria bacterium]|nr:hypothetical protein [Deltaproteobacteria bacterium]
MAGVRAGGIAVLALFFLLTACGDSKPKAPAVSLTVAASRYIGSAPVFVAHEQGFFRDQGLTPNDCADIRSGSIKIERNSGYGLNVYIGRRLCRVYWEAFQD